NDNRDVISSLSDFFGAAFLLGLGDSCDESASRLAFDAIFFSWCFPSRERSSLLVPPTTAVDLLSRFDFTCPAPWDDWVSVSAFIARTLSVTTRTVTPLISCFVNN